MSTYYTSHDAAYSIHMCIPFMCVVCMEYETKQEKEFELVWRDQCCLQNNMTYAIYTSINFLAIPANKYIQKKV